MSILEDIYNNKYRPQEGRPNYPQELRERDMAFWEKITEVLGGEFVDAHLYRICEKEHINNVHQFREGFCLGVQLMMEALKGQHDFT